MNQLINHEAVYGTAPATPGLLITKHFSSQINMEGGLVGPEKTFKCLCTFLTYKLREAFKKPLNP